MTFNIINYKKLGDIYMIDIKGVKIGEGIPKICVPLVGNTLDALMREARLAENPAVDMAEWRADCFDGVLDYEKLKSAFYSLRKTLSKPLLFTVRTVDEGGKLEIAHERYFTLLSEVIRDLKPDLVDIELSCGEVNCRKLIKDAKKNTVATVLSSHNFESTPTDGNMLAILSKAAEYGGDIAKLAVMPDTPADALRLLSVSESFSSSNPDIPVIAVAMGRLGRISRACGGFFGSAVTFAALEQSSAPGQIPFNEMRKILDILHSAKN